MTDETKDDLYDEMLNALTSILAIYGGQRGHRYLWLEPTRDLIQRAEKERF